jgi:hypothetical protein
MRKYEYFQWNWILIIALYLAVLVLSIKLNDPDQKPIPCLVAMGCLSAGEPAGGAVRHARDGSEHA